MVLQVGGSTNPVGAIIPIPPIGVVPSANNRLSNGYRYGHGHCDKDIDKYKDSDKDADTNRAQTWTLGTEF